MFGIGPMELMVIAVVAIVFVGPQRLPSLMRQFGKFFVQAKRYSSDVRDSFQQVVDQAERELRAEEATEARKELKDAKPLHPDESEKVVEEEWVPHPPTEGFVSIEQVAAEEGWNLAAPLVPPPPPGTVPAPPSPETNSQAASDVPPKPKA